ncbi:MAG: alpha/beta hydrolase [Litorimonas sp.]
MTRHRPAKPRNFRSTLSVALGMAVGMSAPLGLVLLAGCSNRAAPPEVAARIVSDTVAKIETNRNASRPSNETPIVFEAQSGETVDAFEGTFTVPENRTDPDSRTLTLHYIRFPTTTDKPGAPIVYLSGGPGGSGIDTAKRDRFPLFMAMRQHGDVIAYDQRGTGRSDDMQRCTRPGRPLTEVVSDADAMADSVAALRDCMTEWEDAGIDLDGYDTVENARDLDALRQHLGAEMLSLWGISYGSHLGLTALRELDGRIERAVFASIEGPEQTVKLPARTDAYFDRLQTAMTERDPETPDVKALIRRVHAAFDAEPKLLTIDGIQAVFHRRDLQSFLSGAIADPKWAMLVVEIYRDMDQGDMSSFEALYGRWGVTSDHGFSPMNRLTDIASGTDAARRVLIDSQAETALIGATLNAPYQFEDIRPELVLDAAFRRPVESEVPVLLLSGTLDGRTYPEAAREAMMGLSRAHAVLIDGAGHNLFMTDMVVGETIHRFMRGEADLPSELSVPIPE